MQNRSRRQKGRRSLTTCYAVLSPDYRCLATCFLEKRSWIEHRINFSGHQFTITFSLVYLPRLVRILSGVPWLPTGGRWSRNPTINQSSSSLRVPLEPGIPEGRIP